MKKQSGFTLIEVMVAMFILLIIITIVATGIKALVNSNEKLTHKSLRLTELQTAAAIIKSDIRQIIDRKVLDELSGSLPAFLLISTSSQADRLEFTRAGQINPLAQNKRSTLQRVAYSLKNNNLIRTTWPVLDRVRETTNHSEVLLTQIEEFHVHVISNPDVVLSTWTKAIDVAIKTTDFGEIHWLVLVGTIE